MLLSAVLAVSAFAGFGPVAAFADVNEEVTGSLVGPVPKYIYFGNYPQTEIVGSADQSGVCGKSWSQEGDYEVNEKLYSELQGATWSNNDYTASDGQKYRKLTSPTSSARGNDKRYDFANNSVHYFRYEPIKWRIVSQNGNDALLLSEIALDNQKYNLKDTGVTWATCSLRTWLNNDFFKSAFTFKEQCKLNSKSLVNGNNINYGTSGGNKTKDKVFLLAEADVYGTGGEANGFARAYGEKDSARIAKSSTYAKAMGAWASTDSNHLGSCYWWLRSPGANSRSAVNVNGSGSVTTFGGVVNYDYYAVRPAISLYLKSETANSDTEVVENDASKVSLSYSKATYSGEKKQPRVTIKGLVSGEDYSVEYENNIKVGKAKVIITGLGNFIGSIEKTFTIYPKKPSVSKLTIGKAGSKKLNVKMGTKVSSTGGAYYEVQYRIKGKTKWSTKKTTSQSLTLSKLSRGKAYQIRVRACKKVGGTTYYSWSSIKTSGKIK